MPVRMFVINKGVTTPLPENFEETKAESETKAVAEALEHERGEVEDALVGVVGEIQQDKLRHIIAEQMPLGTEPNGAAQADDTARPGGIRRNLDSVTPMILSGAIVETRDAGGMHKS